MSGHKRSLLITTVCLDDDVKSYIEFSSKFINRQMKIKVLLLTSHLFKSIQDYIYLSEHSYKYYNRIVDYKPYMVDSFVYYITPSEGKPQVTFLRSFLFGFVFAKEYQYDDVLYIPFGKSLTLQEEYFLLRNKYNKLYYRQAGEREEEKIIYIPYKFQSNFFDYCFKKESFFELPFNQILEKIVHNTNE